MENDKPSSKEINIKDFIEKTNNKVEEKNEVINSNANIDDDSEKVLKLQNYQELKERFERGENLSLEELQTLRRLAPLYEKEEEKVKEEGAVLSPYKKNNYYGFANKNFMLYVFIIAIFIALVLSLIFQSVN